MLYLMEFDLDPPPGKHSAAHLAFLTLSQHLPEFLTDFPAVQAHPFPSPVVWDMHLCAHIAF